MHIQQCGGRSQRPIEGLAEMLTVDAFGVTTIDAFHHIDAYKIAEKIIEDKTSFDRYANPNEFCVVNLDDDILKAHPFKSRKVTFAVEDETADYIGKNIVQNGFARYSSSSIRQSIKNISGRKMYIDCFNVCSEFIKSCSAVQCYRGLTYQKKIDKLRLSVVKMHWAKTLILLISKQAVH